MVANVAGVRATTDLSVGGDTFVSWAVTNTGSKDISGVFHVDLLFDGLTVERWTIDGLPGDHFTFVSEWEELAARVDLTAGTHALKLVVDSTNLIPETNESDNFREVLVDWRASNTIVPPPISSRLPDLAPFTPEGWRAPLIATSYAGDIADGPLSVDVPTLVGFGAVNQGLSSTGEDVWVYLYLDDVLLQLSSWRGLPTEQSLVFADWAGLLETVNVTPGEHTLRLVVDPNDLIAESDEENNTFEKRLSWGTGGVPPRVESTSTPGLFAPSPLTRPNLAPGWRFGWDGPIIASQEEGTFVDGQLVIGKKTFFDIVMENQSVVAAAESFSVDLYYDDQIVDSFEIAGGTRGLSTFWFEDWDGLQSSVDITEGVHDLKIVIDPDDAVDESDEDDNVFKKSFVWTVAEPASPAPVAYTDEELSQKLASLPALLDIREPVLGAAGIDRTGEVRDVIDAVYFLTTGKSLLDERVDLFLFTREDYLAWIDDSCAEVFAASLLSEFPVILANCEKWRNEVAGFKTRRRGNVAVVVDAERRPAEVINTLAHELGHMRQDFLNPAQTEASAFYYLSGLQEAQAQQFERVFWLTLEEFTDLSLLEYPDFEALRNTVEDRFDFWWKDLNQDEHSLGHLLQWLAVLNDPRLSELRDELVGNGGLSASSALLLYDHLVGLAPASIQRYVGDLLEGLDASLQTMVAVSKSRLAIGLNPDDEGAAALRIVGLMEP